MNQTNNRLTDQYNSLYASGEDFFVVGEPVDVVIALTKYVTEGSVLDIGGGQGRNAVYLAERGYSVAVTDISEVGIRKLEAQAKEKGLKIEARISDVLLDGIQGIYDSIVISFVLHHMSKEDAEKTIRNAQERTKAGGVHAVVTFMNRGGLYERNISSGRFYPSESLVRDMYSGWEIEEFSTSKIKTLARNKAGDRMDNYILSMVAIKKSFENI